MSNHQRKLFIVPILHTKEDMGSLGDRLPAKDGYISVVSSFWQEVKVKVCQLFLREQKNEQGEFLNGSKNIKVYQDGLPDTKEELVKRILNEVKSPNYELLRFLKAKGAKILGTEDPKLLKEEYKFVSQILEDKSHREWPHGLSRCGRVFRGEGIDKHERKAANLLSKRDAYIANRIDKTLNKDDLGILFLGAAHKILPQLAKDIQVEIL